ncbi:MAG TPA: hypothetical protein VFO19_07605 [Vicinamibacterales bacterium]|nr:hypothetical protein [Vicinamibacterales bacterium]
MSLWARVYAERRKTVLPLIALFVVNLGVLLLGVWPLKTSVANAKTEAFNQIAALADAKRANQQAHTARDRKNSADVELTTFYSEILPKSYAEASYVTRLFLHDVADRTQLQFQAGDYKPEPIRESRLWRFSGKVVLRGSYQNIRRFLYEVETAPEFVVIDKVELGESGSVQQQAGTGVIEIGLDVSTFFLPPAGSRP